MGNVFGEAITTAVVHDGKRQRVDADAPRRRREMARWARSKSRQLPPWGGLPGKKAQNCCPLWFLWAV